MRDPVKAIFRKLIYSNNTSNILLNEKITTRFYSVPAILKLVLGGTALPAVYESLLLQGFNASANTKLAKSLTKSKIKTPKIKSSLTTGSKLKSVEIPSSLKG